MAAVILLAIKLSKLNNFKLEYFNDNQQKQINIMKYQETVFRVVRNCSCYLMTLSIKQIEYNLPTIELCLKETHGLVKVLPGFDIRGLAWI